MGPRQYEVNHPCGAEMLVGVARARAKQHPHYSVVKIDVNNAFGELDRATVPRRATDKIPKMACLVANIFQINTSQYMIEGDGGKWDSCSPVAGVEQ